MAREREFACSAIDPEDGHVVGALVADIKEPASGIEIEAARIISPGPFLADKRKFTTPADREYPDAVVQSIAGIDEPAVAGHEDL